MFRLIIPLILVEKCRIPDFSDLSGWSRLILMSKSLFPPCKGLNVFEKSSGEKDKGLKARCKAFAAVQTAGVRR